MPSPYQAALSTANNIAAGFKGYQDRTAIDEILEQAHATGKPEDVDFAMTQILSRVSPEKQQMALAILQKKKADIQSKIEKDKISSAYEAQGIPKWVADLDSEAQKDYFKQRAEQEKKKDKTKAYEDAGLPKYLAGLDPVTQKTLIQNQYYGDLLKGMGFNLGSSTSTESFQGVPGVPVDNLTSQMGQSQGIADIGQTLNQISPIQAPTKPKQTLQTIPDEQLVALSGIPGSPGQMAKAELQRRQEARKISQKENSELRQDVREAKKETLPMRQEIANKANAARKGIENKKHLVELINTGNINDPTYATLAEAIPLNLGKRLLSPETVEYKAGLVDEFSDLRNIFQGQTRVKEIELLEAKLADIYLTDEQKKTILKSRINALQADLIKEEAAAEVEAKYPNLGALQFSIKVEEIAKPKMKKLFDQVLDEHKFVINQAEKRKEIALNPKNPDDFAIMLSIRKEAGGDKEAAKKLAKKKGYTW